MLALDREPLEHDASPVAELDPVAVPVPDGEPGSLADADVGQRTLARLTPVGPLEQHLVAVDDWLLIVAQAVAGDFDDEKFLGRARPELLAEYVAHLITFSCVCPTVPFGRYHPQEAHGGALTNSHPLDLRDAGAGELADQLQRLAVIQPRGGLGLAHQLGDRHLQD